MPRLVRSQVLLLAFMILTCSLRLSAQDIDTLDREYHRLSHEHRHATCEHFLLKMLDASPNASWKAASLNRLGLECKNQGRYDDAEKYYLDAYKESISPTHVNRGWIPNNLAWLYLEQGKLAEAEKWGNQARANWEAGGRSRSTQIANTFTILGRIQHAKGKLPEAAQYHKAALSMRQSILGAENEDVSYSMSYLGRMLAEQGQLDEAETMLNQALAMQEKLLSKDDVDLAQTRSNLAYVHRERGQYAEAEAIDRAVLETLQRVGVTRSRQIVEAWESLGKDLEKLDQPDEAAKMRAGAAAAEELRAELVKGRKTKEVAFEVIVTAPQAAVKAGKDVLANAKKGDKFLADHVEGKWYGVAVEVNGERKLGYLNYTEIAVANEQGTSHEIRWQELKPENARFAAQLPGSARLTKQTVNGVDNFAYELNQGGSLFMVSYFDIPAGMMLTFDAAMNAYTTARKGEVVSQKSIERDGHPGREFAVKLPNGETSRMQLIHAGQRWYTLTVEASKSDAYGETANKFLDSIKIEK